MSDTPRTDELHLKQGLTHATYRDFARQLERELNAAKSMIESLEDALIEIEACCYEDNSSNLAADASWHLARKALKKLKEHNQ